MSSSTSSRTRYSAADAWVVPGFVDPHLHLLAMAVRRLSVDLSGCADVAAVLQRLRVAAVDLAPGAWLRADGYSLHELVDGSRLDRHALDQAVPEVPVVLHEAAGHEVTLNTAALRLLGLDRGRPKPGVESREGGPTGRLRNAERLLDRVPPAPRRSLVRAVAEVGAELAAAGVTAVTDATHTNGVGELELLASIVEEGAFRQCLEVMIGVDRLEEAVGAGWRFGSPRRGIVPGHAKAIAEELGRDGLREAVERAHSLGYPVAIHALDVEPLQDALEALAAVRPCAHRDRIEHFSLSLPSQVELAARLGVTVVTQPGFLVERGAKYRAELAQPEQELLYRVGSLLAAGVAVAASSDAPVATAAPLRTMAAAIGRGGFDAGQESVTPALALELVTSRAAAAGSGAGGVGNPEDRVILSGDPFADELGALRVLATWRAGEPIFGLDGNGERGLL